MGPLATLSSHLEGLTPLTSVATHPKGKFTMQNHEKKVMHPAQQFLMNSHIGQRK